MANRPAQLRIDGIHAHVRHPLYTGTLLFTWGLFFVFPFLSHFIAVAIMSLYIIVGIKLEEEKLVEEFGEAYLAYQLKVPMLIPRLRKTDN